MLGKLNKPAFIVEQTGEDASLANLLSPATNELQILPTM